MNVSLDGRQARCAGIGKCCQESISRMSFYGNFKDLLKYSVFCVTFRVDLLEAGE